MSIESRIARGDNPEDVKALFPNNDEYIDSLVKPKKKRGRPTNAEREAKAKSEQE